MNKKRVYVNRSLDLKKIKYIGLDMDHTLVRYDSEAFEEATFEAMKTLLVERYDYPKEILKIEFDFQKAIRGLIVDREMGFILKLNRHGTIRESYRGTKPMTYKEVKQVYGSSYIDISEKRFLAVDTHFSISFACLFMNLVDYFQSQGNSGFVTPAELCDHLWVVLDDTHRESIVKKMVLEDPARFLIKETGMIEAIKKFKKHGKRFFVLTNSDYKYTETLLNYSFPNQEWKELFDWTIVSAKKPRFFYDDLDFLKINENGSLENWQKPLEKGIYQGGCAKKFVSYLDLDESSILYVGDHIYGDILRLKKDCGWTTALVIEELGQEVEMNEKAQVYASEIKSLMNEKIVVEKKLDELICKKIEGGVEYDDQTRQDMIEEFKALDRKIIPLITKQRNLFNSSWGEVMRVGLEESYFAHQVERFADIYMPKLLDLLCLSPRTYLRSPKKPLSHEIDS